jgi:CHAT domain-containing protein
MIQVLQSLFTRDLEKLKTEISLYCNEGKIWSIDKDIANSAGNLCLHLVGNLNTFIGVQLGGSDYIRNRDLEFSAKGIARAELLTMVDGTIDVVNKSLENLDESMLGEDFPIIVFQEKTSIEYMLVHLATHLAYHLGQVNYHRRLLDN